VEKSTVVLFRAVRIRRYDLSCGVRVHLAAKKQDAPWDLRSWDEMNAAVAATPSAIATAIV
jgi:hypothetical protein